MSNTFTSTEFIVPYGSGSPHLLTATVDPKVSGLIAPTGSVAMRIDHGALYSKVGPLATDWTLLEISPSALAAIASSGSASDLVSGSLSGARMPAYTGDVTTSIGGTVTAINANAVTDAKLRDSAATSVIGNGSASAAVATDIAAAADGQFLMRTGAALQFMTPPSLSLTPNEDVLTSFATDIYHDYVIPSDPVVFLHITSTTGAGDWVFGGFTPAMDHQILIVARDGIFTNSSPYCYLKIADSGSVYQIVQRSGSLANYTVTGRAAILIYDSAYSKWFIVND